MKNIGFFGGSFNPITNIHIKIALDLIKQRKLDKVVFVPVNNYYKKDNLLDIKHRYNMIKLSIESFSKLSVDCIESEQDYRLFAVDIFKMLTEKYNNSDSKLYMIMGSDNFNKMPTWKDYQEIKDKYNYIVIDRDENEISSTEIRNMIKTNNSNVKEFLSDNVYKYIMKNNLYR